ncbi:VWA-like domain-containing protein [Mesobacillus maritimus]|uniref:VWA-like domain-containing protein n=1 Tax=Mesobacillus maritimus TaxID=1643336 RepID=UPI00203F1C00|nr:VWA-like domain-containing protein [Mesobacillus maritimus]MCM3585936.1 VWA-like domain-containing protein [Mesobacillus maritimus]MCM3670403.1 VWA-like domain-containing protein [Mesobacillus maritimus]
MRWQRELLKIMQNNRDKKLALVIDTSSKQTDHQVIDNVIKFVGEMNPETQLIQADFKIRSIQNIKEASEIKYFNHGKSSYTEVFEWANEQEIETLLYVTDVTGFLYDELEIKPFVYWLIPDEYKPKVPFGRLLNVV